MLNDVVDDGPEFNMVRPWRQMKRSGNLETLLEIAPSTLINCQQSGSLWFVLIASNELIDERVSCDMMIRFCSDQQTRIGGPAC